MRIWLIALSIAILGICEYAFVEYYPLSPHARIQKFEKLPIVRSVKKLGDIRNVRELIARSDSGFVAVETKEGERRTWNDAEKWYQDFEDGDPLARRLSFLAENSEDFDEQIAETEALAVAGDPSSMIRLHFMGRMKSGQGQYSVGTALKERALLLLTDHPSALSSQYIQILSSREPSALDSDETRNVLLLNAKVAIENYRGTWLDEEQFRKQTEQYKKGLEAIKKMAEEGDEHAVWVVAQLEADGIEMIISSTGSTAAR